MTWLILKRAKCSRPPANYDVFADGKVVGRIYEQGSAATPRELWWFWSITTIAPAVPNATYGHAAMLDEAKAKFRENWTMGRPGWAGNGAPSNFSQD